MGVFEFFCLDVNKIVLVFELLVVHHHLSRFCREQRLKTFALRWTTKGKGA